MAVVALCIPAAQASAATSGTVTVKWNTQFIASIALTTNYSATGAQQITAPSILTDVNGGTGSCTAAGAGSEAAATVNYGNITPDFGVITGCLYKNAVNAVATSTDGLGYKVTEQFAAPVGIGLCAYANGFAGAGPWTVAGNPAVAQTARVAGAGVGGTLATCGANGVTIGAAAGNVFTSAGTSITGANVGEDLELQFDKNAATGLQSAVLTYTIVNN